MNRRIAVRGIFVKDGKLLCVKLKPYKESTGGDYWCTIGGTVDEKESLLAAIEREVIEETGVEPTIGNLLYVQQYASPDGQEHIEFFFQIVNVDDYATIDLSKSSHGQIEIAKISFLETKGQVLVPEFLRDIDFHNFDPNAPTKIFNYL